MPKIFFVGQQDNFCYDEGDVWNITSQEDGNLTRSRPRRQRNQRFEGIIRIWLESNNLHLALTTPSPLFIIKKPRRSYGQAIEALVCKTIYLLTMRQSQAGWHFFAMRTSQRLKQAVSVIFDLVLYKDYNKTPTGRRLIPSCDFKYLRWPHSSPQTVSSL